MRIYLKYPPHMPHSEHCRIAAIFSDPLTRIGAQRTCGRTTLCPRDPSNCPWLYRYRMPAPAWVLWACSCSTPWHTTHPGRPAWDSPGRSAQSSRSRPEIAPPASPIPWGTAFRAFGAPLCWPGSELWRSAGHKDQWPGRRRRELRIDVYRDTGCKDEFRYWTQFGLITPHR